MGGGNRQTSQSTTGSSGLSPRGRGKPGQQQGIAGVVRSIPAWAGETIPAAPLRGIREVYPRVGGGNARMWYGWGHPFGLSPRGRGKPTPAGFLPALQGSIPAWAGETGTSGICWAGTEVYPRVGGGNARCGSSLVSGAGLSPRGRGKRYPTPCPGPAWRSIPAWAGETRSMPGRFPLPAVYPRVGGGNLFPPTGFLLLGRSIPAWAGETAGPAL